MLLGSIIANLSDETSVLETLASLDDLVLLARMREAAAASGEPLGSFTSAAVGTFVAPDGTQFERDLVHHPGAVSVVPLLEGGTVILVSNQ